MNFHDCYVIKMNYNVSTVNCSVASLDLLVLVYRKG